MVNKSKQTQYLHALKFNDLISLQSSTDLDAKSQQLINGFPSVKAYSHVEKLFDAAESKLKNGDEECAFQLFSRMGSIAKLIIQKDDFQCFKQTPDGRRFYDLFKICVANLVKLEESLRRRYEIKATEMQYAAKEDENAALSTKSLPECNLGNKNAFQSKYVITPRELVRYVEDRHQVLIVDYRVDQSSVVKYDNAEKILVAHIPNEVIVPGCIGSSLIRSVAVGERALLQRMSDVDLVVLLGYETDNLKDDKISVGSKEQILYNAMFTYNNMHCLRCPPVFLEGGFENWLLYYPMYASSQVQRRKRFLNVNDQTEFARAVDEYKKGIGVGSLEYPDLTITIDTPAASKNDEVHLAKLRHEIFEAPSESEKVSLSDDAVHMNHSINKESLENDEVKTKLELGTKDSKATPISTILPPPPNVNRKTKPCGSIRPQHDVETNASDDLENSKSLIFPSNEERVTLKEIEVAETRLPAPERKLKPVFRKNPNNLLVELYNSMLKTIRKVSVERSVIGGYTGLKNLGNTCFMNATLQALSSTQHLRDIFTRSSFLRFINTENKMGTLGVISAAFSAVMDSLWSGSFSVISPHEFLELFASEVNAVLANRKQHDAHEFLIYLLDSLHEDTNRVSKRKNFEQNYTGLDLNAESKDYEAKSLSFSSSPVADLFNCRTVSSLRCTICHRQSITFEEVAQMTVEIPNLKTKGVTLMDCLRQHFEPVILEGNSMWTCPVCNVLRVSIRNTWVWKLPKILVIHLKRFAHDFDDWTKNNVQVHFNVSRLDLSPLLHPASKKNGYNNPSGNFFSLYAVTKHTGSLNSGHYTTSARNCLTNEWLLFDDDRVTAVNEDSVCSKDAYILYFIKEDA